MGENIEKARKRELTTLRRVYFWNNMIVLSNGTSPVLATGLTFIFYGLFEKPSITSIFTALNLLNLLRMVFIMLPNVFQGIAQIMVRSLAYPL